MYLDTRALGVTPDGCARFLVRVLFTDKRRRPTTPLKGGNVDFVASRGEAQWQTRLRFNAPSAVISAAQAAPLTVDVRTDEQLGSLYARTRIEGPQVARPSRAGRRKERFPGVVGAALGPHLVQIGWFPR